MAENPPTLTQTEAFLKTIQLYYYEHMIRSKTEPPPPPTPHCDETMAKLQWALMRDEDGDTPLHIAVAKGDEALTRELLNCLVKGNVSCDIRNGLMQTPCHIALITDNPTLAALFIETNATCLDVTDRYGNNGVHLAVKHSCKETEYATLRRVVEGSSLERLEKKNLDGYAPMHLAAQLNNSRAVTLLRQSGADVNILDNKGGASPIVLATRASRREAAQALLELGANPNLRTTYGETASQVASARGDRALSELLAFYDSPYDVTRPSTSTQNANYDLQKRSNKSSFMTSHSRGTASNFKPDVSSLTAPNDVSPPVTLGSRHRVQGSPQAFVKAERESPNKNPPFPESANRVENKVDHLQEALRTQQNHLHHFYPNLTVPLLTTYLPQQTLTPRYPAAPVVTSQSRLTENSIKRKSPNDEPLDLSMKRRKPVLEKSSSHPPASHVAALKRDDLSTNHRFLPPRQHQPSVIVKSHASRQRRYRSDEDYHSNHPEQRLSEKQVLERRRSAPDDLKKVRQGSSTVMSNNLPIITQTYSGRRQLDLHSYTGCLPPHYLHLLESSGNLPSRTNNVLRKVTEVFNASNPAMTSTKQLVTSSEPSVATSVIVMSPREEDNYQQRHLAEKGRNQTIVSEPSKRDATKFLTSPTNSSDPDVTMKEPTSQSEGNNRVGDAIINPNSSIRKFPRFDVRLCPAIGDKHTCRGCTDQSNTETSTFDLNALRSYKKYVTATNTSSTNVVFCSELKRIKIPKPSNNGTCDASEQSASSQSTVSNMTTQPPVVLSTPSENGDKEAHSDPKLKRSFNKSSFSDSDCLDVVSDDSRTESDPREVRVRRKNSLDAKLDQLRMRALDTHQNHYQRACVQAKVTSVVARVGEEMSDQEDLLANCIEDSDSEDEEPVVEVAPPLGGNEPQFHVREMPPKGPPPLVRENGRKLAPSALNCVIRHRVTPEHVRVSSRELALLQFQEKFKSGFWMYPRPLKIPPPLLLYYDVQRKFYNRKPSKIQIFPPKSKKTAPSGDHESCPDDLELCDLEISDDEEGQSHFPNGLRKSHLVY